MDYDRLAIMIIYIVVISIFVYVTLNHISKYLLLKAAEGRL